VYPETHRIRVTGYASVYSTGDTACCWRGLFGYGALVDASYCGYVTVTYFCAILCIFGILLELSI